MRGCILSTTDDRAQHAATVINTASGWRIPGYGMMWASGALWHTSRWGMAFLAGYLARTLSGSPRLVQLTGVAMWMPLLLGGVIGGVISDRFDRRHTLLWQLSSLIPFVFLVGALITWDAFALWMVYPLMTLVGVGWVVDMTSRRALVYDLVGPTRIDQAMALESLALAIGMTLGTLFGGSTIEAVGVGPAFLGIGCLLVGSLVLFVRVPRVEPGAAAPIGQAGSALAQLRSGLGLLSKYPGLVSILGITAAVNFFYFSYTPLVQIVARNLGVRPGLTGLLAAMGGFGMMISSVVIARGAVVHRGRTYCAGAMVALGFLMVVAQGRTYGVVLVATLMAGIGTGFFGSLQSSLVMSCVPAEARGRALGLLSTAIGVLPLGMLGLGELAEVVGTRTAITASSAVGLVTTLVWMLRRPQVLSMTSAAAR